MNQLILRRTLIGAFIAAFICVALLAVAAPSQAYAKQGWNRDSKGNWYEYDDKGHRYNNGWQKIDKEWYYFQSNGYTKSGWIKSGNDWYFLCTPHYAPNNGPCMAHGAAEYDGANWYYLDQSGRMVYGPKWLEYGWGWIYIDKNGVVASNCWKYLGGKWYYFGSDGYRSTNWAVLSYDGFRDIGGKTYYFDKSTAMVTGWRKADGKWYYFAPSGAMTKGWQKVSGTWYLMDSSGVMTTGWQESGGSRYLLSSSGAMLTGWQKSGGNWYYLSSSGAMQKNKWVGDYYLLSDGVMATDQWVDNDKYYVDKNGKWVPGKKKTSSTLIASAAR